MKPKRSFCAWCDRRRAGQPGPHGKSPAVAHIVVITRNACAGPSGKGQLDRQLEVRLGEEVNAQLTQTMQQLLASREAQP